MDAANEVLAATESGGGMARPLSRYSAQAAIPPILFPSHIRDLL